MPHAGVGTAEIVVDTASQLGTIVAGAGPYCSGLHPGSADKSKVAGLDKDSTESGYEEI